MNYRLIFHTILFLLMISLFIARDEAAEAQQVIDLGGNDFCIKLEVDTNRLELPLTIQITAPILGEFERVLDQKTVLITGILAVDDLVTLQILNGMDMPFGLNPELSIQVVKAIAAVVNDPPLVPDDCIAPPAPPGPGMTFTYPNPPRDGEAFLTGAPRDGGFFNIIGVDDEATADAYYDAIDPTSAKTTLELWQRANGFDIGKKKAKRGDNGDDAEAFFLNAGDLRFGRSMHMKRSETEVDAIAYFVTNFETVEEAIKDKNPIATVAMEFSRVNGVDPLFTKFYVFDGAGNRVTSADLDGRGEKFVPGLCIICHGGTRKNLVNNEYPDNGDVGARFLPFDLESFGYARRTKFSRMAQEEALKELNTGVLETEDPPLTEIPSVIQDLVEGWYGGAGLPSPTFIDDFVQPLWDNAGDADLYNIVFKRSCRSCHITQQAALDFEDPTEFRDRTNFAQFRVCRSSVGEESPNIAGNGPVPTMPHANQTFLNFWLSPTPHNGELLHQPKVLEEEVPGVNDCTPENRFVAQAGDFNRDGEVDRDDRRILRKHRNEAITIYPDPLDLDRDGTITAQDLRIFESLRTDIP